MAVNEFEKRNNSDRTTFVTSHSAILAMMIMVFGLLFLSIVAIGVTNVIGNDLLCYLTFFVNLTLDFTCFAISITRTQRLVSESFGSIFGCHYMGMCCRCDYAMSV